MGNGIPITCTTTYQKWTGQPVTLAGSKNPTTLVVWSVKDFDKKKYERCQREEGKEEGFAKGREEGIKVLILDNIEEGKTEEQIIVKLKKRFGLTEEKSKEYLGKYSMAVC